MKSIGLCAVHYRQMRAGDSDLPTYGTACSIAILDCTICASLFCTRDEGRSPSNRPVCNRPDCRAEQKRYTNRELERRYFVEHGEYRARAIERSRPEMKARAAERDRLRNEEIPVRQRYPKQFAQRDARRRELMRAGEPFDRLEVFASCGWVCQLCSQPVDPSLKHPDLLSATIDHIVPLSRGGAHARSNVHLAHLICNIKKSNRLLEELSTG